jgi:hypothetical protein
VTYAASTGRASADSIHLARVCGTGPEDLGPALDIAY